MYFKYRYKIHPYRQLPFFSTVENVITDVVCVHNVKQSTLYSESLQFWLKIGGKLLLIINRKSYMSFRLVPKSVTLNDLEQRNGRCIALFH